MKTLHDRNTSDNGSLRFENESARAAAGLPLDTASAGGECVEGRLAPGTVGTDRFILTRASLADCSLPPSRVVLLTGAWPHDPSGSIVELDSTIDCRFTRLDFEAERLAEQAGRVANAPECGLAAPWVNVLALRYYLVKLLRVIEFFTDIQPPARGEHICLVADKADRDDVALITTICRQRGSRCSVRWHGADPAPEPLASQGEQWWRRVLKHLGSPRLAASRQPTGEPRVVLCGNPRFLDSLCHVMHRRNCRLWWLYDRLAVKPFLRWYGKGIEQLTCRDETFATPPREAIQLPPLEFRGVDLRELVAAWLSKRLDTRWSEQTRWEDRIDHHFRRIRPDLLVMDEDATPMKRIALATARRYGGRSYVIQHGAPVVRFGFAPLAADGFFAWGRSSREQLIHWGVPAERIYATGSPAHDGLRHTFGKMPQKRAKIGSLPRILLLATVPPRDTRPDLIEMNLNSRTYSEMLEAAFAAVGSLPGATLIVKPHPRSRRDHALEAAASHHPGLRIEMSRTKSLTKALRGVDCVLSCMSTAGIEATLAGIPVIQLVPRGAGSILPYRNWALLGSASNAEQLRPLIAEALQGRGRSTSTSLGNVFADADFRLQEPDTASRIADILLAPTKQSTSASRTDKEQGRPVAFAHR